MTSDERWMRRALALAARAGPGVEPNPRVGCVIVRRGACVGEGFHRRYGGPHAEAAALDAAGARARGATAYVSLEPCAHRGKTPPCAEALARAGIRRVVYAQGDPDPRVGGRGAAFLRAAGVGVSGGVLEGAARRQNGGYLARIRAGRPFVLAKWAMTLDGKIAAASGDSRWITSPAARAAARDMRRSCDAVLVGVGTVIADDPRIRGSTAWGRPLVRIVLDSRARTPPRSRLARAARRFPLWIAAGTEAPLARVRALEERGARVLRFPGRRPALGSVLRRAFREGLRRVMVEGGREVLTSLFRVRGADRVAVFLGPRIAGGTLGPVRDLGIRSLASAIRISGVEARRIGDDVLVTGDVGGG